MKSLPRVLGCLALIIFAAACSSIPELQSKLDSWRGAPAHELISSLGQPALKFRNAKGEDVYYYEKIPDSLQLEQKLKPDQWPARPPIDLGCRVGFTVNRQGIVSSYLAKGSDCNQN
jgi:hypothetical protein